MIVDYPNSDNNASDVSIPPSPQLEMEIGDELALMFEDGSAQTSLEDVEDNDEEVTSINRRLRLRPRRRGAQSILDSSSSSSSDDDNGTRMALEEEETANTRPLSSHLLQFCHLLRMYGCPRDGERQALTQALVFLGRHAGGYDDSNDGLLNEAARVLEETVFLSSPESPGEVSNQALENTGVSDDPPPTYEESEAAEIRFLSPHAPNRNASPNTRRRNREERDRVSLNSFQCILILTNVVDVLGKADAGSSSKEFFVYFVFCFLQQTVDQFRSILRQADDLTGLEVEQAEEIGDDGAPSQLLRRLERAETLNNNSLIKHVHHIGGIMRRLQLRVSDPATFYRMLREGNLNFKELRVRQYLSIRATCEMYPRLLSVTGFQNSSSLLTGYKKLQKACHEEWGS